MICSILLFRFTAINLRHYCNHGLLLLLWLFFFSISFVLHRRKGVVLDFDARQGYKIRYEDGKKRWTDLPRKHFKLTCKDHNGNNFTIERHPEKISSRFDSDDDYSTEYSSDDYIEQSGRHEEKARVAGKELVGALIEVFNPRFGKWYEGDVLKFSRDTFKHWIDFDRKGREVRLSPLKIT